MGLLVNGSWVEKIPYVACFLCGVYRSTMRCIPFYVPGRHVGVVNASCIGYEVPGVEETALRLYCMSCLFSGPAGANRT